MRLVKSSDEIAAIQSLYRRAHFLGVRQVVEAVYSDGQVYASAHVLCEVDPEAFLPYSFARNDALELLAENSVLHGQASRTSRHGRRLCRAQRPLCAECRLLDGCPAGQGFR